MWPGRHSVPSLTARRRRTSGRSAGPVRNRDPDHRGSPDRWASRRGRLGSRPAHHTFRTARAARGRARVAANGCTGVAGWRGTLRGGVALRRQSVVDRLRSDAPGRVIERFRRLLTDSRHLPRPPERLRLRDDPGRDRVRRPGGQRGSGRWTRRRSTAARLRGRLQPELGRQLGGGYVDRRRGLVRGDADSLLHAAL